MNEFKQYSFDPSLDEQFEPFENAELSSLQTASAGASFRKPFIVLYWDVGYGGRHWYTESGWRYVGDAWNDKISGIKVGAGRWEFWEHRDFHGHKIELGPGDYPDLRAHGWAHDNISSIRLISYSGHS